MLISEIYSKIQSFLSLVLADTFSNVVVIYGNQTAPRPLKPFLTIDITSVKHISHAIKNEINDLGIQDVAVYKEIMVMFQTFSDQLHNAESILSFVNNKLISDVAYYHFGGNLTFITDMNGVLAVPAIINEINESRAILECKFKFMDDLTDNVGLIERVSITDEINNNNFIIQ